MTSGIDRQSSAVRVFGVIPAAGLSRRMGEPKQLLPVDGKPMLHRVIEALLGGGLDGVVVVTNRDVDAALGLSGDSRFGTAILADPEAEMLESILLGVESVESVHRPAEQDAVLVCPGDMARMSAALVRLCAERYRSERGRIVVAGTADKFGHPIVVPWSLRAELDGLRGVGLRGLLERRRADVVRVVGDGSASVLDVDTPEDYRGLGDSD